jgi:hypothetical protein
MQVNVDQYSDNEKCPFYRTVERLALWTSRHELDPEALASMRPHDRLVKREILWPEDPEDCLAIIGGLVEDFDWVYGVFPGQALEALMLYHWSCSDQVYRSGDCKFFSPVSVSVREADGSKVRSFEFVRWARII